jgi:hypothetical protein
MKVFISWSGDVSKRVADALREWLPKVVQRVEPWMSSADIAAGARWDSNIAAQLDETAFGILCLTRDNVGAPWINFEAGSLAKSIQESEVRVVPFIIGMNPSDIPPGPLVQFQAILPTEDGILRLMQSINELGGSLSPEMLKETVEHWWPDLQQQLDEIQRDAGVTAKPQRNQVEMLAELLELTRGLQRELQMGWRSGVERESADPEGRAVSEIIKQFPGKVGSTKIERIVSISMPAIALSEAQRQQIASIAASYRVTVTVNDAKHQRVGEVFLPSA